MNFDEMHRNAQFGKKTIVDPVSEKFIRVESTTWKDFALKHSATFDSNPHGTFAEDVSMKC